MNMISLKNVSKHYLKRNRIVRALDEIDLRIGKGEFLVVRGPSGSGKTTLLLTIGGMLCPTSGRLEMEGRDLYGMKAKERTEFRVEKIGFVFQLFHLIPYLNVTENVLIPMGGRSAQEPGFKKKAGALLERLNLVDRAAHYPAELSAGEKQRTAMARALIRKPDIILADEPTGNLDPENAAEIARCLREIQTDTCTVILVTHGQEYDSCADRIIQLDQGRIVPRHRHLS